MKQPIRYFSAGLLTASLLLLIFVLFFDKTNDDLADQTFTQMIDTLEDEGYHVLSSEEYITFAVNKDQERQEKLLEEKAPVKEKSEKEPEKKQDNDAAKKTKQQEQKEVHKYTLTIKENMLGPTISKLLIEHKIIDDAKKFSQYLEKEGYAEYLQLGDHKVSSDMSYYEIAETIAKKR